MESTATTELRKSSYTFTWRISNFDIICPEKCESFEIIYSPTFTAGEDIRMNTKWLINILGRYGNIACLLQLVDDSNENSIDDSYSVTCSLKMSLGNDYNKLEHTLIAGMDRFTKNLNSVGYVEFISISELYKKKATLLKNNTLQICVQMEIYGEPYTAVTLLPLSKKCENSLAGTLSTDLQNLFNKKKQSDVEIVCGTKTFYAHKLILSAHSKVFCSMFDSEMKESTSNQIVITDIDDETLYAVLLYMYTGKDIINESTSYTDLIYGAEKYDLPQLKHYCFERMYECVTDDTIGELAVAADTFNANENIKESVRTYCLNNIGRLLKNLSFNKIVKLHPKSIFP